jgi:hypothetical protein
LAGSASGLIVPLVTSLPSAVGASAFSPEYGRSRPSTEPSSW